jgi:hypothetical protein
MTSRYWMGLFDLPTTMGNVASGADPTARYAAFRFDPALDTTWKGVVRDNGATTVVDTGIAVPNDTQFRLTIRFVDGVPTFQVDGANDAPAPTNIPAGGTLLWPQLFAYKDVTGVAQILPWYCQRILMRLGDPGDFA